MPDIAIQPAVIRQRRLKRQLLWAAPAALVVALAAWALDRPSAGPSVRRSDLWIATVEQGSLPIVVSAPGKFEPIEQRWVTAVTPGVVETVRVQPGDTVHSDTVLATLNNPGVASDYARAQANLASARANRASLRAQLTSELLTLQGELATAEAEAKSAAVKERAEHLLVGDHIVSNLEYTATQLQANEYARLAELAVQRIAAFRESLGDQEQAATEQVSALRAVLETSHRALDALSVRAGIDGVVQNVAIHAGQTLTVGNGIARVASLGALKVTLQVPAGEAGEVAINQQVTLELPTDVVRTLRGRVTRVSPAVNDGSVEVDVSLQGTLPKDARPNLAVTGDIHIVDIHDAVYVQRPAYAGPDAHMTLYRVIDDGRAAIPVPVRFGAASDQYIQVIDGLKPGDRVIVSDTGDFSHHGRLALR